MAEKDIYIIEEEDNSYCPYDEISDLPPIDVVIPDVSDDPNTESKIHNNLNNIQGGKSGERYHLNKREYDAIREAANPSETNPFITKKELEDSNIDDPVITRDILSGINIGGYKIGDTLIKDTPLTDAWDKLINPILDPTYVNPYTSIVLNGPGTLEIGSIINVNLTMLFNRGAILGKTINNIWNPNVLQNYRAGTFIKHTLNGITYTSNNIILSNVEIQYGNNSFIGNSTYNAGEQPLNNKNMIVDSFLPGGNTFNVLVNIVGDYRVFFGASLTTPETAIEGRLLPQFILSNSSNTMILNTGTYKLFSVLVPPNKNLSSIKDQDALNLDITSEYSLINNNFTVKDAGNNNISGYKLYVKSNSVSYTTNHRHLITLI